MEGIWEERFLPLRIHWVISVPGVMKRTLVQLPHPNGNRFTIIIRTRRIHIHQFLRAILVIHRIAAVPTASPSTATTAISIMETMIGQGLTRPAGLPFRFGRRCADVIGGQCPPYIAFASSEGNCDDINQHM